MHWTMRSGRWDCVFLLISPPKGLTQVPQCAVSHDFLVLWDWPGFFPGCPTPLYQHRPGHTVCGEWLKNWMSDGILGLQLGLYKSQTLPLHPPVGAYSCLHCRQVGLVLGVLSNHIHLSEAPSPWSHSSPCHLKIPGVCPS